MGNSRTEQLYQLVYQRVHLYPSWSEADLRQELIDYGVMYERGLTYPIPVFEESVFAEKKGAETETKYENILSQVEIAKSAVRGVARAFAESFPDNFDLNSALAKQAIERISYEIQKSTGLRDKLIIKVPEYWVPTH